MNKRLLIVGIDPGTTVGYAVFDFDGKLILLGSNRHFTLDLLVSKMISLGDVIIAGTDRKNPPYFVSQFATKLGAKIIHPNKDLLVSEKRGMTLEYKTNNYHELDALAAAIYASNEMEPLLRKIDNFIRIYSKEHIKAQLRKRVLLEGINIKSAAESIETRESEGIAIKQPLQKETKTTLPEAEELKNKLRAYKNDIEQITRYNQKLLKYIKNLKLRLEHEVKSSQAEVEKKLKSGLYFKDIKINSLLKKLDEKDEVIYALKSSVDTLNIMLSDLKGNITLKKLPDLNYNTYEMYNKVVNITDGDILYVDNPNEYSTRAIELLKDMVRIILYKTQPKIPIKEELPFIFIDANEIQIIEDKFYCTVNRYALEQVLKKQNLLSKVVENYRKTRVAL